MEMPPLPEMPEPDDTDDCTYAAHSGNQMEAYARQYGESCARMAREEAAKLVDEYEFPSIVPHNPEDAEIAKCAGEVLRWRLLNPLAAAIRKG